MTNALKELSHQLLGELHTDQLLRTLYATDASVYRELPLAVAYPKNIADLKVLIHFARQHKTSLIPRTAGTSLAGQCVGSGIVVDVSRHFNQILELNVAEAWVRVEPGVIRDELNAFLKPHGLFFGPNTSTANRCMIGGMVGNNSCGTTSIVYGSTRDRTLELKTILSDGTEAQFAHLDQAAFFQKIKENTLEGQIYKQLYEALRQPKIQAEIRREFPKREIHRRNTGYAIDLLLETEIFTKGQAAFNACQLLCGSEGTLAFTTEIKLQLDPLPAPHEVVVAAHFEDLSTSLEAVLVAMEQKPSACELMDRIILDCTKDNLAQQGNRFFVQGDPAGILLIELRANTLDEVNQKATTLITALQQAKLGYAYPIIYPPRTKNVWDLRKAGLGLLANIPGDAKAVTCIEDTAVALEDLPDYIADFSQIMENFGQRSVYYAHAGAGELHLRPILDLKKEKDVALLHQISEASARLVKKYNGSLSGEHGDGRVRAEFIPLMLGEKNYALLQSIKKTWDPLNIFNPGKIVNAPPMNADLRYSLNQEMRSFDTVFDFSQTKGILRAAEKCNGSGDCRKLPLSGGTMCPSYQATREEKDSTRARANALREFLTQSTQKNAFNHPELKAVMDLCLSCKGCTSECPSNVDMATLKAEFLYQYYQSNGLPWRARVFAHFTSLNRLAMFFPALSNFFLKRAFLKKILGIAVERTLPVLPAQTLRTWFDKRKKPIKNQGEFKGKVMLFCDEFTNYNDAALGIKAIELLNHLGYEVALPRHVESGRAAISKGVLKLAQRLANQNVRTFQNKLDDKTWLIGIEPSAILSFRDEYPNLVEKSLQPAARRLAQRTLLIDEFLSQEIEAGRITAEPFTKAPKKILLHGHCHQKALASVEASAWLMALPENYSVEIIPSGCCGMAGSFGYEKEHYAVSMQIGELVLFPAIRTAKQDVIIAATGTSCRHQIMDGTQRKALHPVEVLWEALERKKGMRG